MAGAIFKCIIDFSNGATFSPALVLDDPSTPLGIGVFGDEAADTLDVTSFVMRAQIRRAYNRSSDSFQTGTASVRLIDENGLFNPSNTSGALYGKILPMRKIRFIGTDTNSTEFALGSMYIQSFRYQSPTGFDPAYLDLNCIDGFQLLNLTTITSVSGGTAGQTTAQRISSILDQADFPGGMRSISTTATTTVQADDGSSRSALGACQTVEQTDLGAFFMNQNGFATFKSRIDIIQASGGIATNFSDSGLPGSITYRSVSFDLSDFGLVNSATVTRTGGSPQSVADVPSQAIFFDHSRIRSSIAQTNTDALSSAQMIIASRKEVGADLRMENMIVDAFDGSDPVRVTAALELDVFDPIQVTQIFVGGDTVSQTVITGVGYDITPNSFLTTFTTAQPFAVGLVIGSQVDGKLGEDVFAY